jgi:hypothetical protein
MSGAVARRSPILPSATAAAWRVSRILVAQLLDEQRHHAGAVADQRLDDVRADGLLTEQARQGMLCRVALEPAQQRA